MTFYAEEYEKSIGYRIAARNKLSGNMEYRHLIEIEYFQKLMCRIGRGADFWKPAVNGIYHKREQGEYPGMPSKIDIGNEHLRKGVHTWDDIDTGKSFVVDITVRVWRIVSGVKISTNAYFQVHKLLEEQVKQIFREIYNDPSKFPIQGVAGWRWRSQDFNLDGTDGAPGSIKHPNHPSGTAIDINSDWNPQYDADGNNISNWVNGLDYDPINSPYSLPKYGIVVQTFKKFGWEWGGDWGADWDMNNSNDYMHFSYLGG